MRRIRPITIRCGVAGCTTKGADAAAEDSDEPGGEMRVIAPKGWSFAKKYPGSTEDVVLGTCPVHAGKL